MEKRGGVKLTDNEQKAIQSEYNHIQILRDLSQTVKCFISGTKAMKVISIYQQSISRQRENIYKYKPSQGRTRSIELYEKVEFLFLVLYDNEHSQARERVQSKIHER